MKRPRQAHVVLALLRDGFLAESAGGTVELRDDGAPVLDYPLTSYVMAGARPATALAKEHSASAAG